MCCLMASEKVPPAVDRQRGMHDYQNPSSLVRALPSLPLVARAGTAYLSLSSAACALIDDWRPVVAYLRDTLNATVTRWDGAVDDYVGTHTVNHAVDLFLAGHFTAVGNMPSCNQHATGYSLMAVGAAFTLVSGRTARCYGCTRKACDLAVSGIRGFAGRSKCTTKIGSSHGKCCSSLSASSPAATRMSWSGRRLKCQKFAHCKSNPRSAMTI